MLNEEQEIKWIKAIRKSLEEQTETKEREA